VLALSATDRGFEYWSDQTKDYKIGICCFSANHPRSTKEKRAKIGWFGIRIMCPSGARRLLFQ